MLWESFSKMLSILRKDEMPLTRSRQEIDSHSWGYTEEDLEEYCLAAEKFYQLFCARYEAPSLTPYMIKLIDHAPQLMRDLPFPIARFQSEGAEHLNYYDSKFYHRKTTRHGGNERLDPLLASFHHRWMKLYYCLHSYSSSDDESKQKFCKQFLSYCEKLCSAALIQKVYKGYRVRKQFANLGWSFYRSADMTIRNSILKTFACQQFPL